MKSEFGRVWSKAEAERQKAAAAAPAPARGRIVGDRKFDHPLSITHAHALVAWLTMYGIVRCHNTTVDSQHMEVLQGISQIGTRANDCVAYSISTQQ